MAAEVTTAEVVGDTTEEVVVGVTMEGAVAVPMVEVKGVTTEEEAGVHMAEVGVGEAITVRPEVAVITVIAVTTWEVTRENLHVKDVLRKNQITTTKDHSHPLGTTYHPECLKDTLMTDVMVCILVHQEVNLVITTTIILLQTVLFGMCYVYTN